MASSTRPIRNRNQPSRNKDNIELNLELIERLEANKANKLQNQGTANYAKLLAAFVNSINEQYRASASKIENQKRDQIVSKGKKAQNKDYPQWGQQKEVKRYVMGSSLKMSTRAVQGPKAQQEIKMEKNYKNDQAKYPKMSKTPSNFQSTTQKPTKNVIKEPKKVVVTIPPSQSSNIIHKPFRRCSYHIGIAYTVYMAQIREKNPEMDPRECDPTFYARRLKNEQLGQQRQNATPHKRQMKFIQQGF